MFFIYYLYLNQVMCLLSSENWKIPGLCPLYNLCTKKHVAYEDSLELHNIAKSVKVPKNQQ